MMGTLCSKEKKNNLELYLNDVYEKECVFKIEQEEAEFIQRAIETLVQELVSQILAGNNFDKQLLDHFQSYQSGRAMLGEKSLVEVYFPVQKDSDLHRYIAEHENYIRTTKSIMIKVGSFYEGTKNDFPDEFDFIFPILGATERRLCRMYLTNMSPWYENEKSLYRASLSKKHQVTRKLEFDNEYNVVHGPAHMLQFIYSNGFGEQRYIHADLVPSTKIIDSNAKQWFVNEVRKYVKPKTFCEEILSAGSCILVDQELAFTEIEKHFMKNILSRNHVKVYRVLKYILNGNGDGQKCKERFKNVWCYTSYCIKTLMIYHHEACSTDTEDLGPCVLHVLEKMSEYDDSSLFPSFTDTIITGRPFLLPYLKSTITALRSIQLSEDSYDYLKNKIQSVSGQYLNSRDTR